MNCNSYQTLTDWGGESSDFEPRTNFEGDGDIWKNRVHYSYERKKREHAILLGSRLISIFWVFHCCLSVVSGKFGEEKKV